MSSEESTSEPSKEVPNLSPSPDPAFTFSHSALSPHLNRSAASQATIDPQCNITIPIGEVAAISESIRCAICQEILLQPTAIVPCGHTYCRQCLTDWRQRKEVCPLCRADIEGTIRLPQMDDMCSLFLASFPGESTPDMGRAVPARASAPSVTCRECSTPNQDGWTCPPSHQHHTCSLCQALFPHRAEHPSSCAVCERRFCGIYWDCPHTPHYLRLLRDWVDLEGVTLPPLRRLAGNEVEARVLRESMGAGSPEEAIWSRALDLLDSRDVLFRIRAGGDVATLDTAVCKRCVPMVYEIAAVAVRATLTPDELPAWARDRPRCWYGAGCRTQTHNNDHATRFSHSGKGTRGQSDTILL
eukprot:gnl/Dysnectes_brevis/3101_a3856_593.p1 GENE.gnl/Dysnectes_brevis/3101_a3856_593~~gnl/Dysnectes_brevis/3101_a3856_593.p1  ORF type:complete len:357 (+),score=84.33 gnl/Dysnectes_brevis/3101_a3856_593:73-1143(+)